MREVMFANLVHAVTVSVVFVVLMKIDVVLVTLIISPWPLSRSYFIPRAKIDVCYTITVDSTYYYHYQ